MVFKDVRKNEYPSVADFPLVCLNTGIYGLAVIADGAITESGSTCWIVYGASVDVDDFPIWAPGKSLRALSQMPSYPI